MCTVLFKLFQEPEILLNSKGHEIYLLWELTQSQNRLIRRQGDPYDTRFDTRYTTQQGRVSYVFFYDIKIATYFTIQDTILKICNMIHYKIHTMHACIKQHITFIYLFIYQFCVVVSNLGGLGDIPAWSHFTNFPP